MPSSIKHARGSASPAGRSILHLTIFGTVLLAAGVAAAQSRPQIVAGYTPRAFSDAYVQDATKAAGHTFDRFLENAAPRLRFEAIAFDSTADLIHALRIAKIDVVGGPPNQIAEIARAVKVEPAFVSEGATANRFDDAVVLVRRDAPYTSIADLRGRTLMMLDGAELGYVRYWFEVLVLREAGMAVEAHFGKLLLARNGSEATLACFFARADACVVPFGAFERARKANRQVGEQLRVLTSSSGLPSAVVAFRAGFAEASRPEIANVVARMPEDVFGREVLKLFNQRRFVRFKPGDLDAADALVREREALDRAHAAGPKP